MKNLDVGEAEFHTFHGKLLVWNMGATLTFILDSSTEKPMFESLQSFKR
jgi:hypothetical protein